MDATSESPTPSRVVSAGRAFARALGWTARTGWRGARGLGRSARRRPRMVVGVLSVVLLVVALAPQLRLLGASSHPRAQVRPVTPTATPTLASADPHALDWIRNLHSVAETAYINDMMAHMSVDEKVGQLIMFEFLDSQMTPTIAAQIKQFHVGGAILYRWNVTDAAGLRQLDRDLQSQAKIPLLIAADQEGGGVDRLAFMGYHPSAEEMGARNNPDYVRQRGLEDGRALADLGINMNLAPVVDVQNIPDGESVMGGRMFGWTPEKVTTMAGAYLSGLQQDGRVVGTLKHFPGLGSVPGDPHKGVVTLNRSIEDMDRIDWAPYRALFATGQVQCVMTTHLDVPAIEPNVPTTVSYKVTTGILRDRLGFQGVIITDGIYMQALGSRYSFEQSIIGSVLAGNDLIASTYSYSSTEQAFNILKAAVADGRISQDRLDASVRRILSLKLHMGLLTATKGA
jgi:beta-N-acetylhexosaminidase